MKKIGMILLAAGSSIRYGGIKLLETMGHKKMYLHIFERVKEFKGYPKVVVTQYDEIYENALSFGFIPVKNQEPHLGISHSIHLGLHKLLDMVPDLDGVLFSVCDQPYLEKETIEKLINAYIHSGKDLACVAYGDTLGNPCIIGKKYFQELFALEGDIGGKKLIKKHPEDVELVMINNELELRDIDRPEDIYL